MPDTPVNFAPPATVFDGAEAHLGARIVGADLKLAPFPYFYLENFFPAALYAEMRRQLPAREAYKKISETGRTSDDYEQRLVLNFAGGLDALPAGQRAFWQGMTRLLAGQSFGGALLHRFAPTFAAATGRDPGQLDYGVELMLVKDLHGYVIGPHTDIRSRVVSIMFYMPSSERYEAYGTSIYEPLTPGFRSDGSRHFPFEGFRKLQTMPCRANAMFAFQRNDVSFHGVERIDDPDCERDVLLYILRWRDPAARR